MLLCFFCTRSHTCSGVLAKRTFGSSKAARPLTLDGMRNFGNAPASSLRLHASNTAAVIGEKSIMQRALILLAVAGYVQAGTIQGVVLEHTSGRPLARTVVRLDPVPQSSGNKAQALTLRVGLSGNFVFPTVTPGLYLLTAIHDGYFPAAFGQRLPLGRGAPIDVTADSTLFAEMRLRRKGAVTGRVLDENGVGTNGIPVVAYRARLPLRSAGSAPHKKSTPATWRPRP
jgi:hypothetical protein